MIVRLTYLSFLPQNLQQAKRIYSEQVVPVVRSQKGNLDCRLLEPLETNDDYISVRKDFAKDPVLKVYTTESILEHA